MQIGVPKETAEGERRVALVPDVVRKLTHAGGESHRSRGVANAPGRGGRAVVHRRTTRAMVPARAMSLCLGVGAEWGFSRYCGLVTGLVLQGAPMRCIN